MSTWENFAQEFESNVGGRFVTATRNTDFRERVSTHILPPPSQGAVDHNRRRIRHGGAAS